MLFRSQHLAVMYAGRIVESGASETVFAAPAHPYTLGLLACRPVLGRRQEELPSIPGQVPDVFERPEGCRFHPRCPFAVPACRTQDPPVEALDDGRRVACLESATVRARGAWSDA